MTTKPTLEEVTGGNLDDRTDPLQGPGASEGWKPREITFRGQKLVVDSEEKAIELMQKGMALERARAEDKKRFQADQDRLNNTLRQLDPLIEIDRRLREDPVKAQKVNAILNDQPLPDFGGETDDPYLQEINGLKRQVHALTSTLTRQQQGVQGSIDEIKRNDAFQRQERILRQRYPWATDETIDSAINVAQERGLDLVTAFQVTTYDSVPEHVRQQTFQEFEIDPRAHLAAQRSEEISLEGFGPLNPTNYKQLLDNPDQYARFRPALREHRRRMSGKLPINR